MLVIPVHYLYVEGQSVFFSGSWPLLHGGSCSLSKRDSAGRRTLVWRCDPDNCYGHSWRNMLGITCPCGRPPRVFDANRYPNTDASSAGIFVRGTPSGRFEFVIADRGGT